jgi:hypothetical protein
VDFLAHALGYKLDGMKAYYEKALTDHDLPVAYGKVPAGTVGAVRMTLAGIVAGVERIFVGAVNRMAPEVAPEWEIGPRDAMYRIKIEGSPALQLDFYTDRNDGAYGYATTALRAANAIPYVCEAKAGLLTALDLPLAVPHGTLRG